MYRLSLIISEIYNKYLPLAEKDGIILNLDFSDTTKQISDPDRVKQDLESHLSSALKRSDQGEVKISVDKTAISITDTGTTLSHSACALLSNRYIDVSSRVGFGTTVKIFLQPRELPERQPQPKLEVEGVAAAVALDNSSKEPTLQTEAKLATKQRKTRRTLGARLQLKGKAKSSAKSNTKSSQKPAATKPTKKSLKAKSTKKLTTVKNSRQLAAAAKKADKEVKRIAKKAAKQSKKVAKTSTKKSPTKVTKPSTKSTAKSKTSAKKIKKISLS